MKKVITALGCTLLCVCVLGQPKGVISGYVKHIDSSLSNVYVTLDSSIHAVTNEKGYFRFPDIPYGKHVLSVSYVGYREYKKVLYLNSASTNVNIVIDENLIYLTQVVVSDVTVASDITRLNSIEGTNIFSGKKNDVILVDVLNANLAGNRAHQIYGKVAGLNVWENDGSGIQLNISTRGLSPNRSWEFNVRQNNYNIQADVQGYPDSYYTPPTEAVGSIEIIRGAASLQYGTQLGGLLNFKMKKASELKDFEMETRLTRGSFNMFNAYSSVGGNKGKLSYFGYFHHRSADGWRQNSDYRWNTGYVSTTYSLSKALKVTLEFTSMQFRLHLSAGLTDSLYNKNAQLSVRDRNWFEVNWNIPALIVDYTIGPKTKFNLNSFMLLAHRYSVENTKTVNIPDNMGPRDIRKDKYRNLGIEGRLLHSYKLFSGPEDNSFSIGFRYYNGRTSRGQGWGTDGHTADFNFLNPDKLEYSDYVFHTHNYSLFAENLFKIGRKLSVVPGIRYEYIRFNADGYYNNAGTLVPENGLVSKRSFPLLGIGTEYQLGKTINLYANATQGYRSVNFNDIRITSPTVVVDPNLKDSKGVNLDIGVRGKWKDLVTFDVDLFQLIYNDRIGYLSQTGSTALLSTNIADSKSTGLESFFEFDLFELFNLQSKNRIYLFSSYSYIKSEYVRANDKAIEGNKVEFAPENIWRTGLTLKTSLISTTFSVSSVDKQFSDANNTVNSTTGNNGVIPAYTVADWSLNVRVNNYKAGISVNNLFDYKYFTRRATSYPGPGLIPAEPRSINVFVGVKL